MARKNVVLTPREEAEKKAARLAELLGLEKAQKEEMEQLKSDLRQYVSQTGEESLGKMIAYRRAGVVQLIGDNLTDKELEYAKEQLCNELPEFRKVSFDLTKAFNAFKTNTVLANAFAARGLTLAQTTEWQFKAAK